MRRARLLAVLAVGGSAALATSARAEPTVWQATGSPRARVESQAIRDIDLLVGKTHDVADLTPMRRKLALHFLEEAGADSSSNPVIAYLYGDLLRLTGNGERALPYLSFAAERGPISFRARALESRGYAFARLGRTVEEAATFQSALDLGVESWTRSGLLSNQGEALMANGDLRQAIGSYRASIECLRGPELMLAVPTFWGLGVALDRSGDTAAALHTIAIARQYDPMDRTIEDEHWAFVPEYDGAWYRALGALLRARTANDPGDKAVAYHAAIDGFVDWLRLAPADAPYVEVARRHVEDLEVEVLKALTVPTRASLERAP